MIIGDGYVITDNGDIVRPDGTLFDEGQAVTISIEHLAIARASRCVSEPAITGSYESVGPHHAHGACRATRLASTEGKA